MGGEAPVEPIVALHEPRRRCYSTAAFNPAAMQQLSGGGGYLVEWDKMFVLSQLQNSRRNLWKSLSCPFSRKL